jgi:hypothetical protein
MRNTYPQFIHKSFYAFVVIFVFLFASVAQASEITPEKVIGLANQDRIAQGLNPLRADKQLMQAAQAKADDMAKYNYFAHTSPSSITPWHWFEQSGYEYRFAGENLAIHFVYAEEQERAWMNSQKHRENILSSKYQDIGVAVKQIDQNGQATIIVVQMFGLPSGKVLAVQDMKMDIAQDSVRIPVANKLVASVNSAQQESLDRARVRATAMHRADEMMLWMEWIELLLVLSLEVSGFAIMMAYRKEVSHKLLRNRGTLRG